MKIWNTKRGHVVLALLATSFVACGGESESEKPPPPVSLARVMGIDLIARIEWERALRLGPREAQPHAALADVDDRGGLGELGRLLAEEAACRTPARG